MSKLSKLFYKCQKLSSQHQEILRELDTLIVEKYGYHYNDEDLDDVIESLDYGHVTLTFREFDKIMRDTQ